MILVEELIDDIYDGMDHTRERLLKETQNVRIVAKKTKNTGKLRLACRFITDSIQAFLSYSLPVLFSF